MRFEAVVLGWVMVAAMGGMACRDEPSVATPPPGPRTVKAMRFRSVKLSEHMTIAVPSSWTDHGTSERPGWGAPGGLVTWTVSDAQGIDPARLEEAVRTTAETVQVKDSRLVEIAGQACIKIAGTRGALEVVHYIVPLDLEHEASIAYVLDPAASADLLAELARRENREAFSRIGKSPRLEPNGVLVLAPIPVMASWDVVDVDGRRSPLAPERGSELLESEVSGAALFLGSPGTGLIVDRLWMSGPIDDSFVDRYVAAQPGYEALERSMVKVAASTELAARLELANDEKGKFQLVYLVRDELRRGWVLSYQAPLESRAEWVARLRAFER